jgi:UPF0755 protein
MKKAVLARRRLFTVGTITATIVIVLAGGAIWWARNYYTTNLKPVSKSQTAVVVTIPTGSSVNDIAKLLEKDKLIRNAGVFTQYVRSKNEQNKLQAGTYSLRPSQSVQEIVEIINGGNILKKLFTILPGQRLDQVKSAMINAGFDTSEVEAALNPDLYKNHPALADKPAGASLEGYLYPDSYQKIADTKPQTIVEQSLDEMQQHLTAPIRDGFVAQGLTVHQGITLASAVEMEVSKPSDRPQVAQVFLSRIKKGMNLESDAITTYGDILAGHAPSTTYDTPYNVYLHPGLPVGPISNVSDDALLAVAHPASTDWLYFVSSDDGTTYFSHTIEEHQALTKQYCKELCQ